MSIQNWRLNINRKKKFKLCSSFLSVKLIIFIALLALTMPLFWKGAILNLEIVNTDMRAFDQSAFMHFTGILYDRINGTDYHLSRDENYSRNLPITHDGARMITYPFIQLASYEPGISDTDLFLRGKQTNVVLSLLLLVFLALVYFKYLPPLVAVNTFLISAFTILIFKAGLYRVDALYYSMKLFVFIMMINFISKPTKTRGFFAGILLAVSFSVHYASVIFLGLAAFVGFSQITITAIRQTRMNERTQERRWSNLLLPYLIFFFSFTILVSPYLIENMNKFGRPFYNAGSTFYMWYDTWEEAKAGTRAHNDRTGWPQMADADIPSASWYIERHGVEGLVNRLSIGLDNLWYLLINSYGWFKYFVAYLAIFFFIGLLQYRKLPALIKNYKFSILFAFLYLFSEPLLTTWYLRMAPSPRYILAWILPWFFVLAYTPVLLLSFLPKKSWQNRLFFSVHLILFGTLLMEIVQVITHKIITINAAG